MITRILFNGHIRTLDPARPIASALAVIGERIVAVGDDSLHSLAGPDTVLDNLGGRTVLPGLTDAHLHFEGLAEALQSVDLFEVPSKEEALRRVKQKAEQTPPGEWIFGRGWVQDLWPDRAFPTAADLDAVAPRNPVYLGAKSGHAAWVNTLALRAAGITAATPDPEGGSIMRDAHGQPTGILFEDPAMELVAARRPRASIDTLADWMEAAQQQMWQTGLTGLHCFDGPDALAAVQRLRERGTLGLRIVKNVNDTWIEHLYEAGIRWGFGDDWIRIGGQKIFADGALGPRTAAMIDPYEGEPNNRGIVVTDKETMAERVLKATALGLPSTIHAIGDRAVHDVLDVFEMARQQEAAQGIPRAARRHRVEHVQIIHPQDRARLAELGLIASMQPVHATSDYEMVDRYWGARGAWAYNLRLQQDQGVVLALGSDAPVEPFDPRLGIYAAVTRRRPDGAPGPTGWRPEGGLTLAEAVHGFTQGPAYAAGMEDRLGRLAPGTLADLIVLDRDWFAVPPEEILGSAVLGTMVGGAWRHRVFD
ncbi:MAG: amidohydrolase [Anaerolineae bacterium]